MASPSSIITLGYGSFGSVNLVPTLGYGISTIVIPPPLYRPQTAAGPTAYRPGAVGGPAAYRPLSATLPNAYRPVSPVTPAD